MTTAMDSPGPLPGSFLPNDTFRCAPFNSSLFVLPAAHDSISSTPSPLVPSRTLSSRKRPRLDHHREKTSQTTTTPSHRETLSPPPLVNTNYRIAGGLDTPTALNFQREEDAQQHEFEVDCRPNRYAAQENVDGSYFPHTPSEENPTKRKTSPRQNGWGQTVWALTGGVAGKVFNFCWNTTFKGFYAGGGNGYQFEIGTPDVTGLSLENEKEDVFHDEYAGQRRHRREQTPIPGGFPDDDEQERQPRPHAVRMTTSERRNSDWVIVDDQPDRNESPVRKRFRASGATTANLHVSRTPNATTSRNTPNGRPRLASRSSSNKSSASYASPRSSSAAVTVTTSAVQQQQKQHRRAVSSFQQQQQQPDARPSSRASLASPRRQSSTPASPEVRKFEQKMRRKEAKQDHTMNRFNAQLQAMIREGQQALGSKVEVVEEGVDVDVDVDEGYEEGFTVDPSEKEYVRPAVWS